MIEQLKTNGENNFILLQQRAEDYIAEAEELLQSWHEQSFKKPYTFPIAQMLGLGIELSLKGYISIGHIGTENNLPLEHDLMKLIKVVDRLGLRIGLAGEDRYAIAALNELYSRPCIVRYPKISHIETLDLKTVARVARQLCQSLDRLGRRQDLSNPRIKSRLGVET